MHHKNVPLADFLPCWTWRNTTFIPFLLISNIHVLVISCSATSSAEQLKLCPVKSYSDDSIVVDGYRANVWLQFYILSKRQILITFRNPLLFHLKLVSHVAVGLIFGGLCWQIGNDGTKIDQNVSFIFLSMLFTLFSSLMPTLMQFPADLRTMIAEYQNRWYRQDFSFFSIFCEN